MPTVTACATLGFTAFDLRVAVERIARRGFRRIEISEMGSYCRHFPFERADADVVRALLDEHGLTPTTINVSTSWSGPENEIIRADAREPEHARHMLAVGKWFLEQAGRLDIAYITFPPGLRVDDDDWPAAFEASIDVLRELLDMAGDLGVGLNLEVPHLYLVTNSTQHALAFFDAIDHPALGATVDSSHWGVLGYDLPAFLAALGPRLRHVHLRDSQGPDTADFKQQLEMTPGVGAADFTAFGKALDDAGYRGEVTLELEHRGDDLDHIDAQYDAGIEHLRNAVGRSR